MSIGKYALAKKYITIENLVEAPLADLSETEDVGETTAQSVYSFFEQQQTKDLLEKLAIAGVNMADEKTEIKDRRFEGKTFVLTGSLGKYTRDEASQIIESLGEKTSGSVSKKTNYVLAGQEAGSKLTKAQDLGIKIITEEDFQQMIK